MKINPVGTIFLFFLFETFLWAETIYLKNGDRISGEIVEESEEGVFLQSEILGLVFIPRESLDHILKRERKEEKEELVWQRELSLGYNRSSGNTEISQFSLSFYANRKREEDEITLRLDSFYSSAGQKMDAQRWYGLLRYAFSFWERRWYNFYKLEADHDRFANVDYRLAPSTGIGYWFSDREDWKAMLEAGLGLEYTDYRDQTSNSNEAVFFPRAFFERSLFGKAKLSQELRTYFSLNNLGEYRWHSETTFSNPITESLSLNIGLINDFDSSPAQDAKKSDIRFISSLSYTF